MQTELTEGQLNTFNSLLKYKDGSAERYRDYCLNESDIRPRVRRVEVPESKTCLHCGNLFKKNAIESNSNFAARVGCSRSCSVFYGKKRRKAVIANEIKNCECCDKEFFRREKESKRDFLKRRTCSPNCGRQLITSVLRDKFATQESAERNGSDRH